MPTAAIVMPAAPTARRPQRRLPQAAAEEVGEDAAEDAGEHAAEERQGGEPHDRRLVEMPLRLQVIRRQEQEEIPAVAQAAVHPEQGQRVRVAETGPRGRDALRGLRASSAGDQGALRRVHAGHLLGRVAEPEPEPHAPDRARRLRRGPGASASCRSAGTAGSGHRREGAAEAAGHPDRPLRAASFAGGHPVGHDPGHDGKVPAWNAPKRKRATTRKHRPDRAGVGEPRDRRHGGRHQRAADDDHHQRRPPPARVARAVPRGPRRGRRPP